VLTNSKVGAVLDIKGNFRVYDLEKFIKVAKVPSVPKLDTLMNNTMKSSISVASMGSLINETCFRIFPNVCLDALYDKMIIAQIRNEYDQPDEEKWNQVEEDPAADKKKGKGDEEEPQEPKEEIKTNDFEILVNNPIPEPEKEEEEQKPEGEGEGEGEEEKKEEGQNEDAPEGEGEDAKKEGEGEEEKKEGEEDQPKSKYVEPKFEVPLLGRDELLES